MKADTHGIEATTLMVRSGTGPTTSTATNSHLYSYFFYDVVDLHVGDIDYSQVPSAQDRQDASSLLKHTDQTGQMGAAPTAMTFYDVEDPPKSGWAHIFSTTSTAKFPQAQTFKLDTQTKLDSANANEPYNDTYSIINSNEIHATGVLYDDDLDVTIVTDTIHRIANLLANKDAYYLANCGTNAQMNHLD